jgi:protein-tyrosine phosphatase
MLERIAQGDVPIVVHCAAGQDRTGIAIALLLSLLDVPIDTITEDYLLTNDACNHVQFMLKQYQAKLGTAVSAHPLLKMPEDIRHAIFTAHADYLHAALDQIDRDHGNVREYLRKEIGVNDSMRANVQQALLS